MDELSKGTKAFPITQKVFMMKGDFGTRPTPKPQMQNRITVVQLLPSAPFFINTMLAVRAFSRVQSVVK
jgi:hypothetical protein